MSRIDKILNPQSIAIIGASRKEGSLGKIFLESVLKMKYKGEIFPVNPKADEIEGVKVYPDLKSLPILPDLAIIILPVQAVLQAVEDIGRSGIKNVVVVSAGFREIGEEGVTRELKLIEMVHKYHLNLLGPNCMGIFNTDPRISFNGTFSPTLPKPGHVAFISQSGALGVAMIELAAATDLGFSIFVSTGNKADLSDTDALEYVKKDNNTKVITLYQESINNPEQFRKSAREIVFKKPILTVKAARTQSGSKAASSHTGALASPDHIIDGFLKQCGVIRMNTLEEMFDAARALSAQYLPGGPRIAIITNAGGPAILASDIVESSGLEMASLSKKSLQALKSFLPQEAAINNPIDMIASASHDAYEKTLEIVLSDDNVDGVILIIVKPPINTTPHKIVSCLDALVHSCSKPILTVLMSRHDQDAGIEKFNELQLPVYNYPESAVKSLAVMWKYHEIQLSFRHSETIVITPKTENRLDAGTGKENNQAPLDNLCKIASEYDIKTVDYLITDKIEDLIKFLKTRQKIVLKIANEQIIHKTEAGLVRTNIDNEELLQTAFSEMKSLSKLKLPAKIKPVFLAQKQLTGGLELVLGGKRDPVFGPVIMMGVGGIFIEILKDVAFRVAPVNFYEAKMMLEELRSQALLNGFRGNPAIDRNGFAYTIQQFSILFAEHPEIIEMDINPLIWSPEEQKAVAVDIRATVQ